MNTLLTEPIWSFEEQWAEFSGLGKNRFNYSFACLSAYLKAHGYNVTIAEPADYSQVKYKSLIKNGNFQLVGITSVTPSILKAYNTAKLIKELSPNSKIVLGGIHATLFPEYTLRECEYVDYVIVGEGEKALLALTNEISSPDPLLRNIPSLVYRRNSSICLNPKAALLHPEEFPFPDYAGAGLQNFKANPPHFKYHPTYQIIVSRGCPFHCAFCNAYEVHGHKVRSKPVNKIIQELAYLKEEMGAKGFSFLDSTFTFNKQWTYEFCEAYEKRIKLPWCCITRADQINQDLLKAMKSSGCWQIGFGFESANEKTLKSMNKMTTVKQNAEAIRICQKFGIRVYGNFIIGWPGETYEDALNTIKWAKNHHLNICLFSTPIPLPNTRLKELAVKEKGITDEVDWKIYDSLGAIKRRPVYVNPLIGYERMAGLERQAYLKYYSSPKVIYHYLRGISTWPQLKMLFPYSVAFFRILISYVKKAFSSRRPAK